MKPGKVVMVLAGRYAGRKAVIVKVKQVLSACDGHAVLIFTVVATGFPLNLSAGNECQCAVVNN